MDQLKRLNVNTLIDDSNIQPKLSYEEFKNKLNFINFKDPLVRYVNTSDKEDIIVIDEQVLIDLGMTQRDMDIFCKLCRNKYQRNAQDGTTYMSVRNFQRFYLTLSNPNNRYREAWLICHLVIRKYIEYEIQYMMLKNKL